MAISRFCFCKTINTEVCTVFIHSVYNFLPFTVCSIINSEKSRTFSCVLLSFRPQILRND